MLTRNRQNPVHIRGIALEMDRHDHLGLRRDAVLDIVGIDVEGFVDLREDGQRPELHHGVVARVPRPGRQNDFVARTDLERRHRHVQRRRARGHRQARTCVCIRAANSRSKVRDLRLRRRIVKAEGIAPFENVGQLLLLLFVVILRSPVPAWRAACAPARHHPPRVAAPRRRTGLPPLPRRPRETFGG